MGQFEEYVSLQRDRKKPNAFYQTQRNRGLEEARHSFVNIGGKNEFETAMTNRLTETTFEERTRYYFEDVKLMQNKMLRYYALSGESGDQEHDTSEKIDAFSRKYVNQKASKRKDAAWDAAVCFDKVVEMQENLKKTAEQTPYQMFEKREEIMRMRMKGMLYAARVKSKNETHEDFLKNKARISCLTIISDQLEYLWAQAEKTADLKQRKKFLKKQKQIEKELQTAREKLRDNSLSYEEAQLLDMGYTDERVERQVEIEQSSGVKGAYFSDEINVVLRAILNQADRDTKLKSFPARCAFVNKGGLPLTYTDKRDAEWNQKLSEARNEHDLETQKDMVMEEIKCMMEYPLPRLEEVKKYGILWLLKEDFHGLYRMIHITAPAICSLAEHGGDPVFDDEDLQRQMKEYVVTHKTISAKASIFRSLGDILNKEMLNNYHLDLNGQGKYFLSKDRYNKDVVEAAFHSLEEAYNVFGVVSLSSKDDLSFDGEREEEEEDVNIISTSTRPKKKKVKKPEISYELERVRLLKINSNLTEEMHRFYRNINETVDETVPEWKYLKEALEDLPHFFDEFAFPADQDLANGWFENQLGNNAKTTMTFFKKVKLLSSNAKTNKTLIAYEEEHPEFAAKRLAATNLADMFRQYFKLQYCIDIGEDMGKCQMIPPLSETQQETEEDRTVFFGKRYKLWMRNVTESEASKSEDLNAVAGENAQSEIAEHATNQKGYNEEYYKAFSSSNRVLYHPLFRARLLNCYTKSITGEGPVFHRPGNASLLGFAGAMLRSVDYDESWKPKTEEDKEKHQWNDSWTRAWEEGDGRVITDMTMSGLQSFFVLELPNRDDLVTQDWVGENLKHQPGKLFEMIRRIQALPMLVKEVPALRKYLRGNPKLFRKINAAIGLCKYANAYINGVKRAGFSIAPGSDNYGKPDPTIIREMGRKIRQKVYPLEKPYYQFVQDEYLNLYDEYLDEEPVGMMRGSCTEVTEEPGEKLIVLDESKKNMDDFDDSEKRMLQDLDDQERRLSEDPDAQEREKPKDFEELEKKMSEEFEDLEKQIVDENRFDMNLSMIEENGEGGLEKDLHDISREGQGEILEEESFSQSQEIIKKGDNTSLHLETSEEREENAGPIQDIIDTKEKNAGQMQESIDEEEEKADQTQESIDEEEEKADQTQESIEEEENLNRIVEHKENEKESEKQTEKIVLDDKVVGHKRRERHLHKESLKQQQLFKKEIVYEKQEKNSNDCWSCAGTALINAYMMSYKQYVWQRQEDMRSFRPEFLNEEEMGVNRRTLSHHTFGIQEFTFGNRSKDRKDSPMGNPFLIADYYLKLLEKSPAHKNTAVRKATFQTGKAVQRQAGLTINGKYMGKDSAAVHNLREHFMDIVAKAIHKEEALTMYYHGHYYFITGINGEKLEVCDSKDGPDAVDMLDVREVIGKGDPLNRPVELVWLDKIEDPKTLQKEFRSLAYDEGTGAFSTKQKKDLENVAHKMGVDVVKEEEDVPKDVSSYVSESIYLPKFYDKGLRQK